MRASPTHAIHTLALAAALLALAAPARAQLGKPTPTPDSQPAERLEAGETGRLRGLVGQRVEVSGRLSGIGALDDEFIIFLNFEGNQRGDFCGIIRQRSIGELRALRGAEFPYNLEGRKVVLNGTLELYQSTPQIEVTDTTQLLALPEDDHDTDGNAGNG